MRRLAVPFVVAALVTALAIPAGAADPRDPEKGPLAFGSGGAVSTVDAVATGAGIEVLRDGGNAVDAAVAAAATLGVTEPYSAGIGGGGFMVVYLADADEVVILDGREEAPDDERFDADVFTDRTDDFFDAVNSGLSVGVPGTLATWVEALDRYGTLSLREALQPAVEAAQRGFVVDETYAAQTADNLDRFRQIASTTDTFLVDGDVPEVGSVVRNRDLADTYRLLQRRGPEVFYSGELADEIEATIADPPVSDDVVEAWQPGFVTAEDLAAYEVLTPEPTSSDYLGYQVYGMPPPSSGGLTVGETLNILERTDLAELDAVDALHRYLEATALAFADRNAYIGDDRYVDVPRQGLLSDDFAEEREARIDPGEAATKPVAPGNPCPFDDGPCTPDDDAVDGAADGSTTHLVTSDRDGNVVSYTLTIEQTGGSAITVPGRGFLLNNELTDFTFTGPSPNLAEPGKRPRSSMSPTIVLDADGDPFLALGSPGGSTIITTVAQTIVNRLARGDALPRAVAAPRATQRNTEQVTAEEAFIDAYGDDLGDLGHDLTATDELGAVTALELSGEGDVLAVAEPFRRGGGDADVVCPWDADPPGDDEACGD